MRRYFVQFPHPGAEGGPERTAWARGNWPHVRKFVVTPGAYRRSPDGSDMAGEIAFWTEWEAASESEPLDYARGRPPGAPAYVHRPVAPTSDQRPRGIPQNTDPFVFGDRFLYTFCAQGRVSARRLHELAGGTVIAFGSVVRGHFVLDTVFVVARSIEHSADTWAEATADHASEAFRLATLEPMYAWPAARRRSFTLHVGATPADAVDGMFSFVPCTPAEDGLQGFARPAFDGVRGITSDNARAVKFNRDIGENEVKALWDELAARTVAAGLALGTRADLR